MNNKCLPLAGLVLVLGSMSCTSGDRQEARQHDAPTDEAEQLSVGGSGNEPEIIRGQYVFGHEVRSLRPCGEAEALWVIDGTKLLRDLHQELSPETLPDADIFVVVAGQSGHPPDEGFGAEYPGSFTVENVIYAALEGFGCEFDWTRFVYRAQGNEPFWSVEILPTEMRLTRPGLPDEIWTGVRASREGDSVVFRATAGDSAPIEVFIEPGSSRDSMSGAYYGLSARIALEEQTLEGYALRGIAPKGP